MLNFSPSIRIFLHAKPIDMRKSFDGLFGIVSKDFGRDVRQGGLFLFINHRRNRVMSLLYAYVRLTPRVTVTVRNSGTTPLHDLLVHVTGQTCGFNGASIC